MVSSSSLPIQGISRCVHSAPVLYFSFIFGVQVTKIVFQFIENNFTVDNKGKDYQQFRFLFELTAIHRKRTNISLHSHVFSFKTISGSESNVRQDIKLLRLQFKFIIFFLRQSPDIKRRSQDIHLLSRAIDRITSLSMDVDSNDLASSSLSFHISSGFIVLHPTMVSASYSLSDFSLEVSLTMTIYCWYTSNSFSRVDLSPFLIVCPSDIPGFDLSRGPRNYPSMFFSLFPIQDCGWVYRTNFTTNSNHSSIFHFNILILITTHVFIQVLLMQD